VAFSESATTTLIVSSPGSIGVPDIVLVPGSKFIHEGNGLPVIKVAEYVRGTLLSSSKKMMRQAQSKDYIVIGQIL
jgi:hypothetical protein